MLAGARSLKSTTTPPNPRATHSWTSSLSLGRLLAELQILNYNCFKYSFSPMSHDSSSQMSYKMRKRAPDRAGIMQSQIFTGFPEFKKSSEAKGRRMRMLSSQPTSPCWPKTKVEPTMGILSWSKRDMCPLSLCPRKWLGFDRNRIWALGNRWENNQWTFDVCQSSHSR